MRVEFELQFDRWNVPIDPIERSVKCASYNCTYISNEDVESRPCPAVIGRYFGDK